MTPTDPTPDALVAAGILTRCPDVRSLSQADTDDLSAILGILDRLRAAAGTPDLERLRQQAITISIMLSEAGVGAMPLEAGVRTLIERAAGTPEGEPLPSVLDSTHAWGRSVRAPGFGHVAHCSRCDVFSFEKAAGDVCSRSRLAASPPTPATDAPAALVEALETECRAYIKNPHDSGVEFAEHILAILRAAAGTPEGKPAIRSRCSVCRDETEQFTNAQGLRECRRCGSKLIATIFYGPDKKEHVENYVTDKVTAKAPPATHVRTIQRDRMIKALRAAALWICDDATAPTEAEILQQIDDALSLPAGTADERVDLLALLDDMLDPDAHPELCARAEAMLAERCNVEPRRADLEPHAKALVTYLEGKRCPKCRLNVIGDAEGYSCSVCVAFNGVRLGLGVMAWSVCGTCGGRGIVHELVRDDQGMWTTRLVECSACKGNGGGEIDDAALSLPPAQEARCPHISVTIRGDRAICHHCGDDSPAVDPDAATDARTPDREALKQLLEAVYPLMLAWERYQQDRGLREHEEMGRAPPAR